MSKRFIVKTTFALSCLFTNQALANANHAVIEAAGHAPIGVMGDHMHKSGEFMLSYRVMAMHMSDNLQGSSSISPDTIVTQVTNPFANPPMSPPTVRVVPKNMQSTMHMLGLMYAPNNDVTIMAMLNLIRRDMSLTTYQGGMGTNVLSDFDTQSTGLGDTKNALLYNLFGNTAHRVHANVGWIIPTGSIEKSDEVLTPMSMRTTLRLPYSMQTGNGSHQAEIGLTYNGSTEQVSWGAQILHQQAFGRNSERWQIGNLNQLSGWLAYAWSAAFSSSVRLTYRHSDQIEGFDQKITAPVTTANPENYGGHNLLVGVGINGVLAEKHRLGLELQIPLNYQVNGIQMDLDSMLTLGYQIAF